MSARLSGLPRLRTGSQSHAFFFFFQREIGRNLHTFNILIKVHIVPASLPNGAFINCPQLKDEPPKYDNDFFSHVHDNLLINCYNDNFCTGELYEFYSKGTFISSFAPNSISLSALIRPTKATSDGGINKLILKRHVLALISYTTLH